LLTDVPREGPKSEPRLLLACDGHVVSFLYLFTDNVFMHVEKDISGPSIFSVNNCNKFWVPV
jgi:hypothetical protein